MDFAPVSFQAVDEQGIPTGDYARFVIPAHTLQERIARQIIERDNIGSMVSRQVHQVSATNPIEETRFIWQNDERDARSEKPLALYHHEEGQMPMLVLGGGVYHWKDLLEQTLEARHYQPETGMYPYWDKVASPEQMRSDRFAWVERVKAKAHGRRVFAFKNWSYAPALARQWNRFEV